MEKYNPKYGVRVSTKNFGFTNGIKSIPLYAAFCIKQKLEDGPYMEMKFV